MNDWIGLTVIVLFVGGLLFVLARLGKLPEPISQEEFDKRVKEAPGLLSAGVMGLQKILEPAVEKAVEVQEDFRQGYYDGEQESGDDEKGKRQK